MKIQAAQRLLKDSIEAARHQDWYSKLHPVEKAKYKKKFPNTKFHSQDRLISP